MEISTIRLVAVFNLAILASCSTLQPPSFSLENEQFFGDQPELISDDQIHQLGPLQQTAFLNYFNDPSRSEVSEHQRLAEYVKSRSDRYTYSQNMQTAEQIVRFGQGNCFSGPLITTAFARLADLEIRYELTNPGTVDDLPSVRAVLIARASSRITPDNNSIYRETFTTAVSRAPNEADLDLVSYSDVSRDGSTHYVNMLTEQCPTQPSYVGREITYNEYLATYYLYSAEISFTNQDYTQAYWLNRKSIELHPNNSLAYNNIASIYRLLGDDAKAELIYEYGIQYLDNKPPLLESYEKLLNDQGRSDEAASIAARIQTGQ